jgi:hypothetical protein
MKACLRTPDPRNRIAIHHAHNDSSSVRSHVQRRNLRSPNCLSTAELGNRSGLAAESQGHDTTNMHLRAIHMHVELQFLRNTLDVLETLLIVGAGTTNPDLSLVLVENGRHFPKSADDSLEGGRNVGEVGDTTTNKENLALGVHGGSQHQVEDGFGVIVCLSLSGCSGVLAVVCELSHKASRCNGISVDDRCTTTCDQSPDAALGVENGQLERSTSLGVHIGNVLFLFAHFATKWRREVHGWADIDGDLAVSLDTWKAKSGRASGNGPLGAALEIRSLVELGRKVEEVDFGGGSVGVGDDDKGVDLEIGELAVDVDGVQTDDEVEQNVVDALWYILQESLREVLVGRKLLEVDGNQDLLGLCIDIADIDTTLVCEQNPVALLVVSIVKSNGFWYSHLGRN